MMASCIRRLVFREGIASRIPFCGFNRAVTQYPSSVMLASKLEGPNAPSLKGKAGMPYLGLTRNASTCSGPYKYNQKFVKDQFQGQVSAWLFATAGTCFLLICLGGYTRLTNSGLSMVDWKPQGRWFPRDNDSWMREFKKYQQFPEYIQLFPDMELQDFKFIFMNEWIHRQLGRGIGIMFSGGFAYFLARGALHPPMKRHLAAMLCVGLFQGVVGWWMVKSGLTEPKTIIKTPRVSPYRLAFHLACGTALYAGLLWGGIASMPLVGFSEASRQAITHLRPYVSLLFPLGVTSFLSGAFVAGNDAGFAFNTWPLMNDKWVPDEVYETAAKPKNIFEETAVVQFNHRILAYTTLLVAAGTALKTRQLPHLPKAVTVAANTVFISYLLQVILGIIAVLKTVPVSLGVGHQALGVGTITGLVILSTLLRR